MEEDKIRLEAVRLAVELHKHRDFVIDKYTLEKDADNFYNYITTGNFGGYK